MAAIPMETKKNFFFLQFNILKLFFFFQIIWNFIGRSSFWIGVRIMMFDATFNNISVLLWQSVLLVEESRENHWPQVTDKLDHMILDSETSKINRL